MQKIAIDSEVKSIHEISVLKKSVEGEEGKKKEKESGEKTQEENIINAIEKANGKFNAASKELSFSVHEATKQIMVKVINKDTKEVIKEIPSEKILDMVANMMETAGIFVDEKR